MVERHVANVNVDSSNLFTRFQENARLEQSRAFSIAAELNHSTTLLTDRNEFLNSKLSPDIGEVVLEVLLALCLKVGQS